MRVLFSLVALTIASTALAQDWRPDDWHLFERYERAKYTQAIATTNGAPSIDKVDRKLTELRYQVPGGLENAIGWTSELYKWASSPSQSLWRLPVSFFDNGIKYYQYEWGYHRLWDEGSKFADVLTNSQTGFVFEVRMAQKGKDRPGEWRRWVEYRDESQQPPGYRRVRTSECRSCHNDASTGGYAVGLAPGGDTVFSHPFPPLER